MDRDEAVDRFRALIAEQLGLAFDETRLAAVLRVMRERSAACSLSSPAYLDALAGSAAFAAREMQSFVADLTVGETYFFRDANQLSAFREDVLPFIAASARSGQILSAGCASGEEAYTLAMILREKSVAANVHAVDVNAKSLERAIRGRYSKWSLRETPPSARERWFRPDGQAYVIQHELRSGVQFEQRNLCAADRDLFTPERFDVVFCRNVLMYLTPAAARKVVSAIVRSLVPGGFLFLGHAESLRNISDELELVNTHHAFYYRLPRAPKRASEEKRVETWFEVIRDATSRVPSIAESKAEAESPPPLVDLAPAMQLIARDRFTDAAAYLEALPEEAAANREVLLLRAMVRTQLGDFSDAQERCQRLLSLDGGSAPAHFLLALCHEAEGDLTGAAEHDRTASRLDPTFAMSALHLGLLATRSRQTELARACLERALILLENEPPARLLLFGGGFGREALIGLCRSHLS